MQEYNHLKIEKKWPAQKTQAGKQKEYNHSKIESKWQKFWESKKLYNALPAQAGKNQTKGKKFYGLIEFPYPSGDGLHVGHPRPYIGMDIISRKRRMEGYNVLYPIGWDAFGLPTENYAIKTGIQPAIVTKKNIQNFTRQIKSLAISFDWSREINTTDPAYYKWTQWIFLQFYKKGLAYKKKTTINWCPKDKIGLANEEVVTRSTSSGQVGCCERCGTPVEKKEKEQWMLAITKYADRLDKDLDTVDYLERIKTQQRNWIGRSEGAEIDFRLKIKDVSEEKKVTVFTTHADTLFGVTYLVLAPEHTQISNLKSQILNWAEVEKYIADAKKKDEMARTAEDKDTSTGSVQAKTGVELKGVKAINPANSEEVPVWIADYVLPQYGTGAVMAVPAHDERDYAFAKKYGLPIRQVIVPLLEDLKNPWVSDKKIIERDAVHVIIRRSDGKVLLLYWKTPQVWEKKLPITFLIGGVEPGENLVSVAKREIVEETGFINVEFKKEVIFSTQSRFFAAHKDVNRIANVTCVLFDLIDEKRVEVAEEEKKLHDWKFVTLETAIEQINIPDDLFFMECLSKEKAYIGDGILKNSSEFNKLKSEEAKKKITEAVGGKLVTKFKLRDWIFSRQRYWGEPIPLIHCDTCGWVPVPEKDLPVKLPEVKSYQPTDNGESPLASISKWVNVKCPRCKGPAKRETDTMPNWAGSSWYYLRYTDPKNKKEFASKKNLKYWTPVDWYNGGMEHTTLHLLYSRFWHKFLYDLKLVSTPEPYRKRTSHGFILAEGGEKMSKSRGNVINPDDMVKTYGADTLRLYEMFMGPFDQAVVWSTESIIGSRRFIERIWKTANKIDKKSKTPKEIEVLLHKTIKKVSEDIEAMSFNTAISTLMILSNEIDKASISPKDFKLFLQLLAPFIPHVTDELWNVLGEKKSIHISKWPTYNANKMVDMTLKIAVQVNGKVRTEILVTNDLSEEEIKAEALKDAAIIPWIETKKVQRVIYVPGRLINIVAL